MPPPVHDQNSAAEQPPQTTSYWPVPPTPPERWASALMEEVRIGHTINVNMLIKHAQVTRAFCVETLGRALIAAADSQQPTMVPILLHSGADVNFADLDSGDTALVTAIGNEDWRMAAVLLLHGADPDRRDPHTGNTPLMVAIIEEDWLAAHLLLHYGANVNLRHLATGQSPWTLAQELGHGPRVLELVSSLARSAPPAPDHHSQAIAPSAQPHPNLTPIPSLPGASDRSDVDDTGPYGTTTGHASEIDTSQQEEYAAQASDSPALTTGLPPHDGPWQHH